MIFLFIFVQAMDEDQLYKELNLTEFEKRFKLKSVGSASTESSPTRSEKCKMIVHLRDSKNLYNTQTYLTMNA